jgi:zinc protease
MSDHQQRVRTPQRSSPPPPLAPVPFHLPPALRTELRGGLRAVIYEDHRLPLVSYRLAFRSGDINDPKGKVGLSSAMTSMLTEGTLNYSSRELAEKVERLGASISASSTADFTIISASSLAFYDRDILEMMAEISQRPTFPDDELDLYKRNSIENLKYQRSQPGFLANEQTARILYGAHPYSRVAPLAAEIERLDRDELVRFHASQLRFNNAVFIAVGAVDRDRLLSELEQQFGGPAGEVAETGSLPEPPSRGNTTITIVDRPGSAQANIVMSNLALKRNHPDFLPATVMNQVLGAGASSRVFMNLREEKGYTYGAYTRLNAKRHAGDFEAATEVRTAVTGASITELFFELRRIREECVTEDELADAKNYLTGVFPIKAETQEGLTNLIVSQVLYELPNDHLEQYRDEVSRVTAEDVQRTARTYIDPDNISIVIVGDAKEILPQVNDISGEISIFDTEGHPKPLA